MEFPLVYRGVFKLLGGFFFSIAALFVVLEMSTFSPESFSRLALVFPLLLLAGVLLWYMGKTSAIIIGTDDVGVKLMTTKRISFSSITKTEFRRINVGKYQTIKVLALYIWYGDNKKIKIHVDRFENYQEFLKILGDKIGDKLASY